MSNKMLSVLLLQDMSLGLALGLIAFSLIVGGAVGYIISYLIVKNKIGTANNVAQTLVEEAKLEAKTLKKEAILEAKEEVLRIKTETENELKEKRNEVQKNEIRIIQKEEFLTKKEETLDKKQQLQEQQQKQLSEMQSSLDKKQNELAKANDKIVNELEKVSGMTKDEAKQVLVEAITSEARRDAANIVKEIEAEAKENGEKKAREIISSVIQRCAADQVSEITVTTIPLPNDDMKGRIIGREGRNIRALENATGIDIIIDDTPEVVIASGFDPVRRHVAAKTVEKLITDGRIHPARIEEMVEKVKKEVEQDIKEAGEAAVFDAGLFNVHPEIVKTLGALKFRTSYGQNVLRHSLEVSYLAGMMAAELGVDVTLAKRGGLLHDIGKAMDHEHEGTHIQLGAEFAKKYKESKEVINAIAAHHGDEEPICVESVLVAAADAISGARPGARRETIETYVKRLEKLEDICNSFEGVQKTFAVQAGREIRVIVKPESVDDGATLLLAKDIAKKIEDEMEYPGQIKVNVIRETRAIEYAK